MLLLSACSKKLITNSTEPDAELYEIDNKEEVSLVFFSFGETNESEKHLAIYKRFAEAFESIEEVHVLRVNDSYVFEFKNYGYYYFNNNGTKLKSGMILSNGVDEPIIETNPDNYIKAYESYFKVPFHDKIECVKTREEEIAKRQKESRQKLEEKFKINENYATRFIKNSNILIFPKASSNLSCLSGKVITKTFNDSTKTTKCIMRSETLYDKNGLEKQYTTFINDALQSEFMYYRNPYNLIDSTVQRDAKGVKSKYVYKYGKNQCTIINVDGKNAMISKVYHLNNKFQCIKEETFNGSGDLVRTTFSKYDEWGRVIEESDDTQKLQYEYKNQQEDFYSNLKNYDLKDNVLLSENIRYEEGNKSIFILKNKDKILFKSIALINSNKCTKMIYNYDADNKLTTVYEYFYEN
ncbi:hypothetical protein [Flavobacterium aestivum]|uniref:hypothetical protein n=1 Tax=Flavobacterium aestivum TaxID=3003257 RepID=UPI002482B9C0|nr:hypothetical protein [Flavobacterium aestivum]